MRPTFINISPQITKIMGIYSYVMQCVCSLKLTDGCKDVSDQISCISFYCNLILSEQGIGENWIFDTFPM